MKILITGATGFIGKTLIPYLFEHDINSITLLVRNHKKAINLFPTLIENIITLENSDWREQIIAYNPDIVLHMATCFTTKSDTENAKKIIEAKKIEQKVQNFWKEVGIFSKVNKLRANGPRLPSTMRMQT